MIIGRFTGNAVDLYEKLDDLVTMQQRWSEGQFGPVHERDARGPLAHLKKECDELSDLIGQWSAGNLPAEQVGEIDKEIADLLILFCDVLWRTGTPSMEEEWKKQELRATIRKYLPQMPDAVALCLKNGAELLLHQDAFAAGYHDDEYTLLGMMVKYAGLYGVNVRIIGKNPPKTFDGKELVPYTVLTHSQDNAHTVVGQGISSEAATEDAYRQIRDLNAGAVEHVRTPEVTLDNESVPAIDVPTPICCPYCHKTNATVQGALCRNAKCGRSFQLVKEAGQYFSKPL